MIKILNAAAIVAISLAPATLSAQNERSSPVPRYHLLQLSVAADDTNTEEFTAKSETIRSCGDARKLAKSLNADVKRNRFISSSNLPDNLRDELQDLPVGHATQVFTDDGETFRVLVLCSRA